MNRLQRSLTLALILVLAADGKCSLTARAWSEPTTQHTDAALKGDLSGSGPVLGVEFYYRKRGQLSAPGQLTEYVRGVAVIGVGKNSRVLDRWESEPTTIRSFYPELNKLWRLPRARRMLITTAVQYGGRVLKLYAFQWQEGKLRQVGVWEGENFSVKHMGQPEQLVIVLKPSDYEIPELYAWRDGQFRKATDLFPDFYSDLGEAYAKVLKNPQALPAAALVQSCRLALQAYRLAGAASRGRSACTAVRERIAQGTAVVPGLTKESAEQFEGEKKAAITEIDILLRQFKGTDQTKPQTEPF